MEYIYLAVLEIDTAGGYTLPGAFCARVIRGLSAD